MSYKKISLKNKVKEILSIFKTNRNIYFNNVDTAANYIHKAKKEGKATKDFSTQLDYYMGKKSECENAIKYLEHIYKSICSKGIK